MSESDDPLPQESPPPPEYEKLTSIPELLLSLADPTSPRASAVASLGLADAKMGDITEVDSLLPQDSPPPPGYRRPTFPSRQLVAPQLQAPTPLTNDIKMDEMTETSSLPPLESSPPLGYEKPTSPSRQLLAPPMEADTFSMADIGQMVCGSCHQLLCHPRGSIHIKCPCCQIVNFILEEHQVGNVKCEKCTVLLIYPYGAPAVRCSCCRFVTKIGPHNLRPPLSVQQGRAPHVSTAVK